MCVCMHARSAAQSCLTLCDPMDCSPPGSSVHGIFQARILEWVAISSSTGSSWPRDQTRVSYISCSGRQILYHSLPLGSPLQELNLTKMLQVRKWKSGRVSGAEMGKPSPGTSEKVKSGMSTSRVCLGEGYGKLFPLHKTSSLWIHSQASSEQLRAGIRHQGQRAERPNGQGALTHTVHHHIWPQWPSEDWLPFYFCFPNLIQVPYGQL